jgi:hypothetical protein
MYVVFEYILCSGFCVCKCRKSNSVKSKTKRSLCLTKKGVDPPLPSMLVDDPLPSAISVEDEDGGNDCEETRAEPDVMAQALAVVEKDSDEEADGKLRSVEPCFVNVEL